MKRFRNYHMCLEPIRKPGAPTVWRCMYCGWEGDINERNTDCTHVYETCEHCGGSEDSNECKPDCPGIAAILARPDLYVIGGDE